MRAPPLEPIAARGAERSAETQAGHWAPLPRDVASPGGPQALLPVCVCRLLASAQQGAGNPGSRPWRVVSRGEPVRAGAFASLVPALPAESSVCQAFFLPTSPFLSSHAVRECPHLRFTDEETEANRKI